MISRPKFGGGADFGSDAIAFDGCWVDVWIVVDLNHGVNGMIVEYFWSIGLNFSRAWRRVVIRCCLL